MEFSFPRFSSLFAYELGVGYKKYLKVFAILFGILSLIVLWSAYTKECTPYDSFDPMLSTEVSLFTIALFIMIVYAASKMFADMGRPSRRLTALMLPASSLEKFVARWIIAMPVTIVGCLACFWMVDLLRVLFVKVFVEGEAPVVMLWSAWPMFNRYEVQAFIIFTLLAQAFFTLGAIIWPKGSMGRTFLALFVIGIGIMMWGGFLWSTLCDNGMNYDVEWIPEIFDSMGFLWTAVGVTVAVCYTVAYMRLREIELIQRW